MKKIVLIESISILSVGFLATAEGLRLIFTKDPHTLYDMLGPGSYVLTLGIIIMITGGVYFFSNRNIFKTPEVTKLVIKEQMNFRVISMVMILGIYVFFIKLFGYVVASIVFFLLTFKIIGIKSWLTNGILSLILTAAYYLIFIHYCNMVFPRGIFY